MPLVKTERPKPPPRRPSAGRTPEPVPARKTQTQKRYEGLQGIAQFAGAFCLSRGWYADAGAIGMHSPVICQETVKLADQHEPIGKVLDYLSQTGPYLVLVRATLQLGAQIAVNHGKLKPEQAAGLNVVPPELLEAQAKSEFVKLQRMAMEEKRKADAEMKTFSQEMNGETGAYGGASGH